MLQQLFAVVCIVAVFVGVQGNLIRSRSTNKIGGIKCDNSSKSVCNSSSSSDNSKNVNKQFIEDIEKDVKFLSLTYKHIVNDVTALLANSSFSQGRQDRHWIQDLTNGGRNQMAEFLDLTKSAYKKNMGPLLLAYKLKFFALFPFLIASLIVVVKASGLAGFFFALFVASLALRAFHL